ncbi:beta-ketoacyl synthase N-terminal-like domain-containing protein [Streptomyces cavourensis]|uniref:beta-ketoacyl synthase N-terminal-like domain-containing protein n=1 Tax=Streptomyces cavourensis TaxID=67258 RepID=UPI00349EE58D
MGRSARRLRGHRRTDRGRGGPLGHGPARRGEGRWRIVSDDIAVTGIGLVTPGGTGTEATWETVCAGRATARVDPVLTEAGAPVRLACRVAPPGEKADEEGVRGRLWRFDPATRFLLTAAREALRKGYGGGSGGSTPPPGSCSPPPARPSPPPGWSRGGGTPGGSRWWWARRRAGSPRWRRSTASCSPPAPARSPR